MDKNIVANSREHLDAKFFSTIVTTYRVEGYFVGVCRFLRFPRKHSTGMEPSEAALDGTNDIWRWFSMKPIAIVMCLLLTACSPNTVPPVKQSNLPQPATPQPAPSPAVPAPDSTTNVKPTLPATQGKERYVVNEKTFHIANQDNPKDKVLLLTFDDGPTGDATLPLLDILDRHGAKSIWFVNGHQLGEKRPDGSFVLHPKKVALLKEIHKRGHLIGNHTWWHENLRKLPANKQREEIVSTSLMITQVTGEKPRYFRPPFGAGTPVSEQICRELGMMSVNWSVGSLDWEPDVYRKPSGIAQQVLKTVHNGGNILFHDRIWTAKELDSILRNLREQGYRFVLPTVEK
jgi:peptidoglycan/xylan/chitin deacetylase (PgdA/CDA1 family)